MGLAIAALVTIFCYQVAYGTNESSYVRWFPVHSPIHTKGCMCVITVDGKKWFEWNDGDLDGDPALTNGHIVATTGPGTCDNTTGVETCESGNFIPIH